MAIILIWCFLYCLSVVYSHSDSESAESNRIEVTPFYDTIIYSDIADIINDFENNGISPFDIFTNSESQSDEKVEDLLTEYQHHLERAQKQRKSYVEKSKTKNKVPLVRHEQFAKSKPGTEFKHDYYYPNSFHNPSFKYAQSAYSNPLDVFIPFNAKGKYMSKSELTTSSPKGMRGDLLPFEKILFPDKKILDLPPLIRKSSLGPIKSSCYCKNGQIPCECNNCKQCLIDVDAFTRDQPKLQSQDEQKMPGILHSALFSNPIRKLEQSMDDNLKDIQDNTLNIRIKVDLQLPQIYDIIGKNYKSHNWDRPFIPDDVMPKEMTTIRFPYFNFPVPMDAFGYKKPFKFNKDDSTPIHKITIHKKKKSRPNNNNKKHRKKIITFHNIKLEQQPLFPIRFIDNITDTFKNNSRSGIFNETTTPLELNSIVNKTDNVFNYTHTDESISLVVNITNNAYNTTEDGHKFENSIEIDFTKMVANATTMLPILREKREVHNVNNSNNNPSNVKSLKKSPSIVKHNISKEKNNMKKSDKNVLSDAELLYWPSVTRNETHINKKNITTIILENEHKKTKINMSKETIRQNHTKALEQAIFGDVDWNDVDTVAPAFMSFVGKYVRGILTFCSQQVCHSMKCANKTCLHRVCVPVDRLNNKGHCAGSNSTDSIASMESIMDLPSNIAFEVVDILQNKMLGKIFGKATFCINNKCITLVASKKTFFKTRCTIKELTATGHCLNTKTVKVM